MKNFLMISFCFLFATTLSFAQRTTKPILIKGTSAVINLVGPQTQAKVEPIDALLVINHLSFDAIEEIEVITGAYDAKYRPTIKRIRPRPGSGVLAHFYVEGHPRGPYSIFFKSVNQPNAQARRQQNRRVEIKIVFN
ncbi:MAG: hypothetical protein AAF242_08205 [Bacteroidota bacterium]